MRQDFLKETAGQDVGDLATLNGDFITGPSDAQHVADIIVATQGSFKEYPALGVGLFNYLASTGLESQLVTSIVQQLSSDGYQSLPVVEATPNGQFTVAPNATINQS